MVAQPGQAEWFDEAAAIAKTKEQLAIPEDDTYSDLDDDWCRQYIMTEEASNVKVSAGSC